MLHVGLVVGLFFTIPIERRSHAQDRDVSRTDAGNPSRAAVSRDPVSHAAASHAAALHDQVARLTAQGQYARAIPLAEEALALRERALGPEHPAVAQLHHDLAALHQAQGNYHAALPLYRHALALLETILAPDHPDLATAANNLAVLYQDLGNYHAALPLYQHALAIREKALGPDHAGVAQSLNNLAMLHQSLGDHGAAGPLMQRALAILDRALPPDHPDLATALNNLAMLHQAQGQAHVAEPLYRRALAIRERTLGPDHADVAAALNNLAMLHRDQGHHGAAEPLMRRALAIRERALGPDHPSVAIALNNLALLHQAQGALDAAGPLYRRALAIQQRALGPDHPDVAISLDNLSTWHWARGEIEPAVRLAARAEQVREAHLDLVIAARAEHGKRAFLDMLAGEVDRALSLAVHTDDPGAQRLAMRYLLRRKGRALDSLADNLATLRSQLGPAEQALFDEYRAVSTHYATQRLRGAEPGTSDALARRRQELEQGLAARSQAFRARRAPVTIDAVQAALPPDAALVEWALYWPFDPGARTPAEKHGPARYAACLLPARGTPACLDLGEAASIDARAEAWRAALQGRLPAARAHARALEARLVAPVRALLERALLERALLERTHLERTHLERAPMRNARHLFIAPDGDLALIPFAALVDEQGRHLIERYHLTHLTSGRDLLRLASPVPARQGPVIVAAPDFDAVLPGDIAPAHDATTGDLLGLVVAPLPATAREAEDLALRLAGAQVWTGAVATEARLVQVEGPVLLHVATHGIWLHDGAPAPMPGTRQPFTPIPAPSLHPIPDPMLRSGLALAGFNRRRSGSDDGFLTALELASMDLRGTRLVVLSACDTGLGEIASGQGVYGLRRALVLAGAETQVMSLWSVDDAVTRDLMRAYYDRLLAGEGRSEAMRQAQLALLREQRTAHPYFWAGFLVSGNPGPMTGLLPRARPRMAGVDAAVSGATRLVFSWRPRVTGILAILAVVTILAAAPAWRRIRRIPAAP